MLEGKVAMSPAIPSFSVLGEYRSRASAKELECGFLLSAVTAANITS